MVAQARDVNKFLQQELPGKVVRDFGSLREVFQKGIAAIQEKSVTGGLPNDYDVELAILAFKALSGSAEYVHVNFSIVCWEPLEVACQWLLTAVDALVNKGAVSPAIALAAKKDIDEVQQSFSRYRTDEKVIYQKSLQDLVKSGAVTQKFADRAAQEMDQWFKSH